ncbi:hypothetical protein [Methylobacterium sp. AMS5]|uniref:hypothetical protein n=1 Tax=Methylobacterium sp. AMS5 TaxID=925818 RepID=UPI00074FA0FD|nr:hypothetical protein [Methylobacterium sp. AMS5]AMB48242.1 hypothetical protein Y590_25070 [Methylobacterium sp. AMS5]
MRIADRYAWANQATEEWPRWLMARNWARNPATGRLVIHGFPETLVFMSGEEILLRADQIIVKNGKS